MKNVTKIVLTALVIGLLANVLAGQAWAQEARWQTLNQQVEQLYQQGRYAEAIPVAKEALRVAETTFGPNDPNTATSLDNLAVLYYVQGKYAEAEPLFIRALAIGEKTLGPDHLNVATNLYNLGALYNRQGKYAEAEPLYRRALAIQEKALGPDHPDVAYSLTDLAVLYYSQGKYAEAEPLFERGLPILEKALGRDHPEVATGQEMLARVYLEQGRYSEAESLYKGAQAIRKKTPGSDDYHLLFTRLWQWRKLMEQAVELFNGGRCNEAIPKAMEALWFAEVTFGADDSTAARILHFMGALYYTQGRYAEAEPFYKRALAIYEKALGREHPHVANSLNGLAKLYYFQVRYAEAEPFYKRALAIREKVLPPDHPGVAESLNNLAELHRAQGRYAEAEPLFKHALAIWQKALGREHSYVATGLNNLASLYYEQGRYAEAEPLFKSALAIWEKARGREHSDVATGLNNLANLYYEQGRYAEAEPLFKGTLAIREKVLPPDHPGVAESLNNLANLYYEQGRYAEAEPLLKRALAIRERVLPAEHPDVANSLNNLASLYYSRGRWVEADSLYKRALTIVEKALGPEHYTVAISLNNLAVVQVAVGRSAQALPLMIRCLAIDERTMDNVFPIASEREKFAFLNTVEGNYEVFLSLIEQELKTNSEAALVGLDATLRRKGIVLEALSRERQALASSSDPQVAQSAQQMQEVSSRLATLTLAGSGDKSPEAYRKSLAELEAEKERLENKLARLSGAYAAERQSRKADCQGVAQALPPGSALVEFVCPRMFNFKARGTEKKWGEYRYLAFVLPAGKAPKPLLVDLGSAEAIDNAVREFRHEVAQGMEASPQLGEAAVEQRLAGKSRRVYDLVFAPLKNALGGNKLLFLSPDGDLNLIPFGALQDESGRYLAENYQLNYLSSGRDLLRFQQPVEKGTETIIVADPDYNLSGEERVIEARSLLASNVQLASRGTARSNDLRAMIWERLPGSLREAEAVSRLLAGEKVRLLTGKEALEELFKGIQSPRRLHLATHGFFLDDEDKSEWLAAAEQSRGISGVTARPSLGAVKIENPLLRSGLVLAGANRLGKEEFPEGAEDGILTALEISGIPLWGTDLVVLSACETGVGETRRGEGVFGLRRAFQLAGARTVVMSLWSVPDAETQELMTDFYRRMKVGTGKAKALQEASLALMQARREKVGAAHPYFWAAFVCVGEP